MSANQQDATIQQEIVAARDEMESHIINAKRALESLQQLARGDINMSQFRSLNAAVSSFAPAKKAVELGRKIVRRKLQAELSGLTKNAKEEI